MINQSMPLSARLSVLFDNVRPLEQVELIWRALDSGGAGCPDHFAVDQLIDGQTDWNPFAEIGGDGSNRSAARACSVEQDGESWLCACKLINTLLPDTRSARIAGIRARVMDPNDISIAPDVYYLAEVIACAASETPSERSEGS